MKKFVKNVIKITILQSIWRGNYFILGGNKKIKRLISEFLLQKRKPLHLKRLIEII